MTVEAHADGLQKGRFRMKSRKVDAFVVKGATLKSKHIRSVGCQGNGELPKVVRMSNVAET